MLDLLKTFSWQELRQHPWRGAAAVVSVMLGVALAFSVHLINASALSEFSDAVRSVSGQPDLQLQAASGTFDEALFARVATDPRVELAAPVLEVDTVALAPDGARKSIKVLGVDALVVPRLAPALAPVAAKGVDRLAMLSPRTVFLNPAARHLPLADQIVPAAPAVPAVPAAPAHAEPLTADDSYIELQAGLGVQAVKVAGTVAATGAPLAVMDIGAAQDLFGLDGRLSRIDLKLAPGVDHARFIASLALPAGVSAAAPGAAGERAGNLSRAYRVNLTVLALIALFTGAFLVFSVLSLSVAKRSRQFALLGVLGLTGRERLRLVLAESLALGVVGSVLGLLVGTALAALALSVLGGDLGGGYFSGVAPPLQLDAGAALIYGLLGVLAALVGGWLPARAMQHIAPAQALKGLSIGAESAAWRWLGPLAIALSALLALLPPVFGIPVAAYLSVALLLGGGIATLPALIVLLYGRLGPWASRKLLPMLAVERARRVRSSAAIAVSGVVAALALAVALTVMVASFRDSVTHWLDAVLPADLYLRSARGSAAAETANFPPDFVQAVAALPGVARVQAARSRPLQLDPAQPAVTLIARDLGAGSEDGEGPRRLPLVGPALPVPVGAIPIYVSEAMPDLYGARPGTVFPPISKVFEPFAQAPSAFSARFFVAGVYRDYARQFGSIAIDRGIYRQLTGDDAVNDIALTVTPGTDLDDLQRRIRDLAQQRFGQSGDLLEFASASQLRATSLRIFDRSFAVTYWLQAVAIGIGLFGVAASFSAQVLARRKEFGLLAHLGLTRGQILAVVAGEGAAFTLIGAVAGLALGLAVSLVLVRVVNPQSFHWTMDLLVPWLRLFALAAAVVLAGTVTAWLAGHAAAGREAVLAVKEDW